MSMDARMMKSRDVCKWAHRMIMLLIEAERAALCTHPHSEEVCRRIAETVTHHKIARQMMLRNGYITQI